VTAAAMLAALPDNLARRYVVDGECLRWTGATNGKGYGLVTARVVALDGSRVQASRGSHRVAWETVNGPIPRGHVLDHYRVGTDAPCIGTMCSFHVEPVTVRENTLRDGSASLTAANARKTHCPSDHPYDEDNTYVDPSGARECRTCRANRRPADRARRAARLALGPAAVDYAAGPLTLFELAA
jgi:hypothetical protein